jgi:hypothetical protein
VLVYSHLHFLYKICFQKRAWNVLIKCHLYQRFLSLHTEQPWHKAGARMAKFRTIYRAPLYIWREKLLHHIPYIYVELVCTHGKRFYFMKFWPSIWVYFLTMDIFLLHLLWSCFLCLCFFSVFFFFSS